MLLLSLPAFLGSVGLLYLCPGKMTKYLETAVCSSGLGGGGAAGKGWIGGLGF